MQEIKNSYKLPMDTSMAPDKIREVSNTYDNNSSVFTDEKINVATLVLGKDGDPKSGLGSWTDAKGKEKFLTEIDDSESSIIPNSGAKFAYDSEYRKSFTSNKVVGKVSDILKHDKLFNHTPEAKNINIEILRSASDNKWTGAQWTGAQAMFQYQYDKRGDIEKIIINGDNLSKEYKTEEEFKSILLHEMQHQLQYGAVIPKKDIGKVESYSRVSKRQKDAGLVKGYQNAETYFDAEPLAEGQQDNLFYDSKGIERPMSTPLNYLVTQHMKRILPNNTMSTVPFPPNNPGEEAVRGRLLEFMGEISEVESRNKNVGNKTSSAEGFFQFLTDDSKGQSSLQTAIKRTKKYFGNRKIDWMDKVAKTGDVMSLSYEQQMLLAIGDLMEKKGSDDLWLKFFKAKTDNELAQAKREIYSKLHHTDTQGKNAKAIAKNMNTIESWKIN